MIIGKFYVLTYGKRYVRDYKYLIVGNQLQHAQQFATATQARSAAKVVQTAIDKKPVRVWFIAIEEVT